MNDNKASVSTDNQKLNEEQEKAAFCDENAVIAAGAGSGKTRVLANRFVYLLTEKGYEVDKILTLTFTKKAAAEMFRRIYYLVLQTAENEKGIKAQRAQKAVNNFIHARIQTLDSYSASIVRQCAPRYGISPDFKIEQDRCYELALEISYPFFIANRSHPAIQRLYSVNRPNDIVNNIFAEILFKYCNIDKPRDFFGDVEKQFNIICIEWKKITDKIKFLLDEIERDYLEDNKLLPLLESIIKNIQENKNQIPSAEEIRKYFDTLLSIPKSSMETAIEVSESHPMQKIIIEFLNFIDLFESHNINLKGGKKNDNPVKDNIKLLRAIHSSLSSLSITFMQSGLTLSIMSLLTDLQDVYLTRKRTEGILSYNDISNLSKTILIEQEDIRQSEKEAFNAIMIDEFQDNNELQKDILFLLAEKLNVCNKGVPCANDLCPGKLFFVGDEKQSIFLFRGADVSVFRKLKQELKSSELPLKINYRSSPHLIGAFNAIFGGHDFDVTGKAPKQTGSDFETQSVFTSSKSTPIYEASYTPLEAGIESEGKISLCILNSYVEKQSDTEDDKEKEDEKERLYHEENEAKFVAEKIQKLLSEKTKDGKQKYMPHDIAILFRTSSPQPQFEKHLRFLGIPYSCENINNLFYGGLVNDIISVLRLVSHPLDSASYAEMLRSPFAGLSLAGTSLCLSLFHDRENESLGETSKESSSCRPFDNEALTYLNEFDSEKYKNGQKVYSTLCEKAESESISSLVSVLWYNEGYRYETEWNQYTSVYREMFDYLFHHAAAADSDNQTLAAFTDLMISNRDAGGSLSDIDLPLERPSAVRLTTIHKSKGLEYPVVFLCCCGKTSQRDICEITYFSNETGIVFSPPPPEVFREYANNKNNFFWEQASEEERRKRTAELRRLLYVGMTRARNELYITGSLKIKDVGKTDDFSLAVKKFIEDKYAKRNNYIEDDSILNDDTFFGLMLPSLINHIPQDGFKKSKAFCFYNFEEIPVFYKIKNIKSNNDQENLNIFIKNASIVYDKCETINTPVLYDNHITPVSLKRSEEDNIEQYSNNSFISKEFSGLKADDVFVKIDSLLSLFSQDDEENSSKFNSGSFGTIAHICIESLLNKEEPQIPSNISCLIKPDELTTFIEAGKEIAKRFIGSPLGKIAESASLRENEFPFRSLIKNKEGREIFINGTIDLFFEDKNCFHVVDFKTDNKELPGEHTAQMACYYKAVTSVFAVPAKKECRIWLYYLRTGHAVEMTERAKNFNIEQRAFDNERLAMNNY